MTETQLQESIVCQNCDHILDTVAGNGTPKEEDIFVCLYCGETIIKLSTGSSRNCD